MKKAQIPAGMCALAGQIQKIKDQQKRLGLFCKDRELLSGEIITGRTPSKKTSFLCQ
jgi:hypothetical protein